MSFSFNKLIDQWSYTDARHGFMNFYQVKSGVFSNISATAIADLISTTMVANDAIYFTNNNNGFINKFGGVNIDVGQAIVATGLTLAFEYRKADGTWAAFAGLVDNTVGFTVTGQNSITWTVPTDWGTDNTAINGIAGVLWARIRIVSVTSITTAARKAATMIQYYNYAINIDDNTEYDSGTFTSASSTLANDTSKAWVVDSLRYRIVYIHTGTGAGQRKVVVSNTASQMTFFDAWDTVPDNTSQYSILANMEDVYQADVAAGWGLVTKNGEGNYFVNCNLEFWLCGFGSIMDTVEFGEGFIYTQRPSSSTSRYIQQIGYRLPAEYGVDMTTLGSTWVVTENSQIDNRRSGFFYGDYTYLYGSNFTNRFKQSWRVTSHLRFWFFNHARESINNKFQGFRSVEYGATGLEAVRDDVSACHSGIENPIAKFSNMRTYAHSNPSVFFTGASTHLFDRSVIGLSLNTNNCPINEYAFSSTTSKMIDPVGARFRPMGDIFGATSNGVLTSSRSFRIALDDEMGNLISGARCIVKNAQGTVLFDRISGQNILNPLSVTNGNTYTTFTEQPDVPDRLRFTISGYTDTSSGSHASMVITGTDKNGNVIKEKIFIENIGEHTLWTLNEFASITSIYVLGMTATVAIDRYGSFGRMQVDIESWQSTNDTSLTDVIDYNPFTIKISKGGFDSLTKKIQILDSFNEWIIGMKRSELKIT